MKGSHLAMPDFGIFPLSDGLASVHCERGCDIHFSFRFVWLQSANNCKCNNCSRQSLSKPLNWLLISLHCSKFMPVSIRRLSLTQPKVSQNKTNKEKKLFLHIEILLGPCLIAEKENSYHFTPLQFANCCKCK